MFLVLFAPSLLSSGLFFDLVCTPVNNPWIDSIKNKVLVVSFFRLLSLSPRSLVAMLDLSLSLYSSTLQPLNPNHGTEPPASKLAMVNAREAISCLVLGFPWRSATMGRSRVSMEVGKLHCLPCGTAKVDKLHSSNRIVGSADDNDGWAMGKRRECIHPALLCACFSAHIYNIFNNAL